MHATQFLNFYTLISAMTPFLLCFVYVIDFSQSVHHHGFHPVPKGSDEPLFGTGGYGESQDKSKSIAGEPEKAESVKELKEQKQSSLIPPSSSPSKQQKSDKTMEGWLILLIFVAVFILLILASIYVFGYHSWSKKHKKNDEQNEVIHDQLSITIRSSLSKHLKSYMSPSMSVATDYVSSFNSNQSNAYNVEYKIEETKSMTAPTNKWLQTKLLGKGRFGCVHLCIDLQSNSIADTSDHECNQAKTIKKRIKNTYIWLNSLLCDRSKDTKQTNTKRPEFDIDAVKLYAVKRAEFEIDDHGQNIVTKECKSIYDEINILVGLKHKHIVKMYGSAICKQSILMFMECCGMGNLSQILKEFGPFDLITTHRFIKQLLCAIEYLHSLSIVHRDIKGRNILIAASDCVKLADFGSSVNVNTLKDTKQRSRVGGTVHWMPPEIFQKTYHSLSDLYKHDIWSLGVVTIEMLTCHPINYQTKPKLFTNMLKNNIKKLRIPVMDNEHINAFINKCLTVDFTERPTASELMKEDVFILADDIFDSDEEAVAVKYAELLDAKQQTSKQKIEELIRCNQQYFA